MTYASDTDIADAFFEGETVPDDNTISTSRNTNYQTRVQNFINRGLRTTSDKTDASGSLKETFL